MPADRQLAGVALAEPSKADEEYVEWLTGAWPGRVASVDDLRHLLAQIIDDNLDTDLPGNLHCTPAAVEASEGGGAITLTARVVVEGRARSAIEALGDACQEK